MGKRMLKYNFNKLEDIDDRDYIDKLFDIKYPYFIQNDKYVSMLISYAKDPSCASKEHKYITSEGFKSVKIIVSDKLKYIMYDDTDNPKYFYIQVNYEDNYIIQKWTKNPIKLMSETKYNGKKNVMTLLNMWDVYRSKMFYKRQP